jgi:endonuclease YncB( thermonuclease family)
MSGEESMAIFICRILDKPWIERITQKFDNVHIPYTMVAKQGDRDTWQLNDALRNHWKYTYPKNSK